MSKTLEQRFNEKWVENPETGCWDWQAYTFRTGYGALQVDGKPRSAHRVSYELFNGPIPEGEGYHGTCVCHRCDRPCCVNPSHLFLGTNDDNLRDMVEKGRQHRPRGEINGSAKLSQSDVEFIRWALPRWGRGGTYYFAKFFGVSQSVISRIKNGRTWKDVSLATTEDGK